MKTVPSWSSATETRIRAYLEDHREDVLACVDGERAVVRVERTAEGDVISLQGEGAGGPAEGCLRAALGTLPAGEEDTDQGGVLLHLVR